MKWILLVTWLAAIFYTHFRGAVRLPLGRQLLDHSILLAPVNAFMILTSRLSTAPYLPDGSLPELKLLEKNWQEIREEALRLASSSHIKASDSHNDIGFNSFFKYGWKRFYLKWYDASHPSALELCPKTICLLNQIPRVKAAMFAELPPGSQLNPHRDPFAGSLRYHLGIITPNDDRCYISVDGIRKGWRDGQGFVFDETYVHEAHNKTEQNRIILFVDIERPLMWGWAESFNRWFGRVIMTAASSPNSESDQTGWINRLTHFHWVFDQKRRAFKKANLFMYKAAKFSLIGLALYLFIKL
jgi:beta-hydroxylase